MVRRLLRSRFLSPSRHIFSPLVSKGNGQVPDAGCQGARHGSWRRLFSSSELPHLGSLVRFVLVFFAQLQQVFALRFEFVLSSFFGTFVDSKRVVEFVPLNSTSFCISVPYSVSSGRPESPSPAPCRKNAKLRGDENTLEQMILILGTSPWRLTFSLRSAFFGHWQHVLALRFEFVLSSFPKPSVYFQRLGGFGRNKSNIFFAFSRPFGWLAGRSRVSFPRALPTLSIGQHR